MTDSTGAAPDGEAPASAPAEASHPLAGRHGSPGPGGSVSEARAAGSRGPADQEPGGAVPDRFRPADPLAPYRPAEPTFQADPAVRELEVPFDTGQLESLATGQLLTVRRPEAPIAAPGQLDDTEQRKVYGGVSVTLGVIGAAASLFVGWMLPVSIAAIVFGVLGLRREAEARVPSFVGIGAGVVGIVFSIIWIGYYAILFGALPS